MRGTCVRRFLGLGALVAVAALAIGPAAHAGAAPRLEGVHAALESRAPEATPGQFGSNPDAFERAVLRSQASTGYTPQAMQARGAGSSLADSHERTDTAAPAGVQTRFGSTPDAFERAVLRSESSSGYTPAALDALGKRWEAYAASFGSNGTSVPIADSHERVDLPATSPASVDRTGIAWIDVLYGMLLGVVLVALGGIAAMAVRTHGRVSPS